MLPIVNIAAYKFVPLADLDSRRDFLRELTRSLDIKGTILLTPEGINLFLAGSRESIDQFLSTLREDPQLADIEVKESLSADQPFERMLVKLKQEIIAFGIEGIEPRTYTSRKLPARELQQWLRERDDVVLYDVRNDYEVEVGTFTGAVPAGIDHFRDFPEAVAQLPEEYKQRPIVMFCTGGIRCEKAGPFMEQAGFQEIYQLEGGILKYFEECGSEHYTGDCFVFDKRVALTPALDEAPTALCYACLHPVSVEEQQSPDYNPPRSCPHCYQTAQEKMQRLCDDRNAAIAKVCNPLPGSTPYDNVRPISIPLRLDRHTLGDALREMYPHIPLEELQQLAAAGQLVHKDASVTLDRIVRAGERYGRLFPAQVEPPVSAGIQVIYEDNALIVVSKPAPLPMHPCGRFNRNSLEWILKQVYQPAKPRPAHRLDANTTGVVVLTKSRQVAARLQPQFERDEVEKVYLARVVGHPTWDEQTCDEPISRESQNFGGRTVDPDGLPASTHARVLERLSDGTTLLEVRPKTGRTNQIRVHLW
ncbi:MAG: sulfurtransferase, partial [Planctomycetaceae bacterium]|nr:sulfurtransferase [Planctomycetaceae bacterium]